jgi:hypothetical protein
MQRPHLAAVDSVLKRRLSGVGREFVDVSARLVLDRNSPPNQLLHKT